MAETQPLKVFPCFPAFDVFCFPFHHLQLCASSVSSLCCSSQYHHPTRTNKRSQPTANMTLPVLRHQRLLNLRLSDSNKLVPPKRQPNPTAIRRIGKSGCGQQHW